LPYDLIATSGAIYVSGQLGGGHDRDFLVTEIDDSTGACRGDGCMETLDLSKWKTVHKFEKKWLWGIVAGGHPLVPPPADTVDDPTTAGATIEFVNPGTGERATFVLPPGANWTPLTRRGDPTVVGYRYDDPTGAAGPCTQFSMVSGGKLKLKCKVKGSAAPFSLDEASQGVLDVHLQIGRYPYCLSTAGGRVVRDEGGSLGGPPGSFKVVKAPPPVACER
jgi:hypothetical protein